MNNSIMDQILPFLSLGMMAVFAFFVIIGLLYGLVRGAKRSGLRLVIFVGLVLVTFFITPLIVNGTLNTGLKIAGRTPSELINYVADELVRYMQQQFGDYAASFRDEIKKYAVAFVKAILNLVVFYVLYFIVKFVGWIIYAITAHFVAPKRDRSGKKLPKYAGWGALIGAVQGVLLFIVFMFPFNGLIGVVNHAAEYQAAANNTQAVTTQATTSGSSNNDQVAAFLEKMNGPLKAYNNLIKYTGVQFFSDKAFEYQLTVRIDDTKSNDINLLHDLNSGLELYVDMQDVKKVLDKLQNAYHDGQLDLSALNGKDYNVLRAFINKAFDLQILNVANDVISRLDPIFAACYSDDKTYLVNTEEVKVYQNSIYGLLTKNNAVSADHYAEYALGLQNLVKYVGEQQLNLVRDDLINMVDLLQVLDIYEVKHSNLTHAKTLTSIMAEKKLGAKDYLDLCTARLVRNYPSCEAGKVYQEGDYLINVLGHRLMNFKTVQMVGLKGLDQTILYSKQMEHVAENDADLKELVNGLIPMFIGEDALDHGDKKGNWSILGGDLRASAAVLRNYVNIKQDIDDEEARLIAAGKTESSAKTQAVLNYLGKLAVSQDEYNEKKDTDFAGREYSKYLKVDDLVDALYDLTNHFQPVKTYVHKKLAAIGTEGEGNYINTLLNVLEQPNKGQWYETMHHIVDVADVISDSPLGDLVDKIQNGSTEDLAQDFVDAVKGLDANDVTNMLTAIMDIPEAKENVKKPIDNLLGQVSGKSDAQVMAMLGDNATEQDAQAVIDNAAKLKKQLDGYTGTKEQKDAMSETVEQLWSIFNDYQNSGNIGA